MANQNGSADRRRPAKRVPQPEQNMAEKAVDEQNKAKGGNFLEQLMKGKPQPHKPVLKALEELGIQPKIMSIMLGDEPVDCVVIPAQELLLREYEKLSGVSISSYTVQDEPEQVNQNG